MAGQRSDGEGPRPLEDLESAGGDDLFVPRSKAPRRVKVEDADLVGGPDEPGDPGED